MKWFKFFSNFTRVVPGLVVVLVAAAISVSAATFVGTGTGAIPDRAAAGCGPPNGPPLDITFNATGLPAGTISNVSLSMTATHTWVGDLDVNLIAPGGSPSFVIFASTGSTTPTGCGSANDLGGTYVFNDTGLTGWWTLGNPFPAGTYRTTVAGDQPSPPAGNPTNLTAAFAGVANPNGNWILRITDGGGGDTGNVSAASLTIDTVTPQHVVDYNGDGKTDFSVVRNTGGGPSGQLTWYNLLNGPGTISGSLWGIASDFITPGDYDGDGKTDIAIWRGGAAAAPGVGFYILQSMTNTVRYDNFGQTGDDPTVIGDYDGDGKTDIAIYRAGAMAGAQSFWWYKGSFMNPSGNLTPVPWGQNGDFPAPGNYDGDTKADFAIQRNAGGGAAVFWLNQSTAGIALRYFGTPNDVIVPGDYDGDGKTDIAVVRGAGGVVQWWVRRSSDNVQMFREWGLSATDFTTQGDFDGDGTTDFAVWRPSATPGASAFYAFRTGPSTTLAAQWGQNGDYPVGNFNSH